jgi:post-segregation antitoxin (ccd killing protein)
MFVYKYTQTHRKVMRGKQRGSLSSLSSMLDVAIADLEEEAKPKKKRYNLYLSQDVVEGVRARGFNVSHLVERLLEEVLARVAGPEGHKVHAVLDDHFRECVEFARKHRDKWDDPQHKAWWDNWFRQTAEKYGYTVEQLKQICKA